MPLHMMCGGKMAKTKRFLSLHLVVVQNLYGHFLRRDWWAADRCHQLATFRFVPSILKPYFHLGLSQFQHGREAGSLRAGEVLLLAETSLEFEDLRVRESRAGTFLTYTHRQAALLDVFFLRCFVALACHSLNERGRKDKIKMLSLYYYLTL